MESWPHYNGITLYRSGATSNIYTYGNMVTQMTQHIPMSHQNWFWYLTESIINYSIPALPPVSNMNSKNDNLLKKLEHTVGLYIGYFSFYMVIHFRSNVHDRH